MGVGTEAGCAVGCGTRVAAVNPGVGDGARAGGSWVGAGVAAPPQAMSKMATTVANPAARRLMQLSRLAPMFTRSPPQDLKHVPGPRCNSA